jgi:hypothetical protein
MKPESRNPKDESSQNAQNPKQLHSAFWFRISDFPRYAFLATARFGSGFPAC